MFLVIFLTLSGCAGQNTVNMSHTHTDPSSSFLQTYGEGDSKAGIMADRATQACWKKSGHEEAMTTAEMQASAYKVIECLHDTLDTIMEKIVFKTQSGAREDVKATLVKLRENLNTIFWNLQSRNDKCPCGTMASVLNMLQTAEILSKMIEEFYSVAIEQRLYDDQ